MSMKSDSAVGRFLRGEAGAVTVDWVVLTAAVIGMGMVVLMIVAFSSESSANRLGDYIRDLPVGDNN